jgi:hypothetical protein
VSHAHRDPVVQHKGACRPALITSTHGRLTTDLQLSRETCAHSAPHRFVMQCNAQCISRGHQARARTHSLKARFHSMQGWIQFQLKPQQLSSCCVVITAGVPPPFLFSCVATTSGRGVTCKGCI